MAISVRCAHCGRGFEVGDELAGQPVRCGCGHPVQVGEARPALDLLWQELDIKDNPLLAETPAQWAKATGAPPEIAEQLEKKMSKKLASNAGFMMAVTGAVIAMMLVIGLVAFLLARRPAPTEGALPLSERVSPGAMSTLAWTCREFQTHG